MKPHNFQLSKYVLSALVIGVSLFAYTALAQTASLDSLLSNTVSLTPRAVELQQNIASHQDEIKKLESEIVQYQQRLTEVGSEKKTLQTAVKTLDLTRSKLTTDAKLTQVRISQTSEKIEQLSDNIDLNQQRITKDVELIGSMMRQIDQEDSRTLTEAILTTSSISDLMLDIEDIGRLQISLRDSIASLKRLRSDLSKQKNSFEAQQKNLLSLNSQLSDQKKLADQKRNEQTQLLKETQSKEANYKKLLAEKQQRKTQFERDIDTFEAQLRAEIDPSTFPKAGTRVLAYPLDDPMITQKFGRTVDSVRLYTSGSHNGIDFRASPGTAIKAAGDGTVIGTGDTDLACRGASYGRWVMIKHKNGLSTMYSHLELIKVSEGQNVSVGQTIGYSGTTGYATGPHLHFGLFVTSATQIVNFPSKSCVGAIFHIPVAPANGYLDPQAYL